MASWNGRDDISRHIAFASACQGEQQQNFANFVYDNDFDYNYFNHHPFPGVEGAEMMKNSSSRAAMHEKNRVAGGVVVIANNNNNNAEMRQRKTRLTSDQLDALERSFQEEIKLEKGEDPKKKKVKLEPERKMWLARELGLHPRQVAIWFQNRRARLKGKQLERLYNALKQEFEIISRQNLELQHEVMKLKAKLDDRSTLETQGSTGYIEVSEEEKVVESTSSVAIGCSNNCIQGTNNSSQTAGVGSYIFSSIDEYYSTTSLPFWVVSPSYPDQA